MAAKEKSSQTPQEDLHAEIVDRTLSAYDRLQEELEQAGPEISFEDLQTLVRKYNFDLTYRTTPGLEKGEVNGEIAFRWPLNEDGKPGSTVSFLNLVGMPEISEERKRELAYTLVRRRPILEGDNLFELVTTLVKNLVK